LSITKIDENSNEMVELTKKKSLEWLRVNRAR